MRKREVGLGRAKGRYGWSMMKTASIGFYRKDEGGIVALRQLAVPTKFPTPWTTAH